jgi:UDP-glucuronate decarboxylase
MKRRALVSGGAGFLGSHLCERLLKKGKHVICVDNLHTGNMENINHLLKRDDFEFVNHDISVPIHLEVDEIYNLACPASPVHYQSDPIYTIRTNFNGMYNMLMLAKKNKARIFHASTSEVYGDPAIHPQKEEYWGNVNPVGIRSCYDEGKRIAETLCFDFKRKYNLDIRMGRIFNTYGPKMLPNDGRVVSNFIVQALDGKPITIYGDGKQTRSFCYVDDLIDIIVMLMEKDSDEILLMNIGNNHEFTILELAQMVVDKCSTKSGLQFSPLPSDDPKQRRPDLSKTKKMFDWEPKIQLDEGLSKTIEYFEKEK